MRYLGKYIHYLFSSRHRRGYGVHSPYMFYFVTKVLEEKLPYYRFLFLSKLRQLLQKSSKILVEKEGQRVCDFVREELSDTYLQMLFRIVEFLKPQNVVELGSSLGLSTLYIASTDSKMSVEAWEPKAELASFAQLHFSKYGFSNITIGYEGFSTFEKTRVVGSVDFLYISATLPDEYLEKVKDLLPRLSSKAVVVFAKPYKSENRELLWMEIRKNQRVRVDMDLFTFGLLFFNEDFQKESYNFLYFPPLFT